MSANDLNEEPDETKGDGRFSPECGPTGEDELWAIILALVEQSCGVGDDELDSWATSAYERAIEALDHAGFVKINGKGRIGATILPKARKFEEWIEFHDRPRRIREARHMLATVPGLTPEGQARLYNITVAELMAETHESWPRDHGDKP